MKKQFAIIGLGRFGHSMAETLIQSGCEVIAIDTDEDKIQAISDLATYAVQVDATDEKALRTIGLQNVDTAVVSIGEDIEASILIVMTLKELGVKEIVAKAVTPIHGKILRNLGVSRVVFPEREVAIRLANSLAQPAIIDYMDLSAGYSVMEIPAPQGILGSKVRDSRIRERYGVNLIAIRRKIPIITDAGETDFKEDLKINPDPDEEIAVGDILVVLGSRESLASIRPA